MLHLTVHHWSFVLCRVNFDTQQVANGEDIPLVKAAKTVFDTSNPSFWSLCALVSPISLIPAIRLLARKFPGKVMRDSQKAFETLYDASDALIEVGLLSGRILTVLSILSLLVACAVIHTCTACAVIHTCILCLNWWLRHRCCSQHTHVSGSSMSQAFDDIISSI